MADRWAAETAADPMVNTAVIAGGLTNALARYGEPGDVLCLLADDFTATLTDGTIVTLEDLRDGNVDAESLGFGVHTRDHRRAGRTPRTYPGRDSRWSVEQLDDHDRLTRVTVFPHDDLLGAANALDHAARQLAENTHIPGMGVGVPARTPQLRPRRPGRQNLRQRSCRPIIDRWVMRRWGRPN